jgi:hypothetical protein
MEFAGACMKMAGAEGPKGWGASPLPTSEVRLLGVSRAGRMECEQSGLQSQAY